MTKILVLNASVLVSSISFWFSIYYAMGMGRLIRASSSSIHLFFRELAWASILCILLRRKRSFCNGPNLKPKREKSYGISIGPSDDMLRFFHLDFYGCDDCSIHVSNLFYRSHPVVGPKAHTGTFTPLGHGDAPLPSNDRECYGCRRTMNSSLDYYKIDL